MTRSPAPARTLALLLLALCAAGCPEDVTPADACTRCALDGGAGDAPDAARADGSDAMGATCTPACTAPGSVCRAGACADDCRAPGATPCAAPSACDYTDGRCRAPDAPCFLPEAFEPCPGATPGAPARACGPGTSCDGRGSCITNPACTGVDCDLASGRCWARSCPCDRPAPRCTPASLEQLNRPEFTGAIPSNMRDEEGAFDLEFDDVCAAYAATLVSGTDYLRQMTAAGEFRQWNSVGNLNMGEVAVLRLPGGEFTTSLGDVAATYICCATCGCTETGMDGRLGVIRLDRASTDRPLPNVLRATPTSGAAPWGSESLDTGPYGLTWGPDRALYVGNVMVNGDFVRVDLAAGTSMRVAMFASRVVASAVYDLRSLLVATEDNRVQRLELATGNLTPWATLPGNVTSLSRDGFTGRVYAEVRTTPPGILELRADGSGATVYQMPPRIGRIAIAPDGFLYHLSVYPAVQWMSRTAIVRWPLPARR